MPPTTRTSASRAAATDPTTSIEPPPETVSTPEPASSPPEPESAGEAGSALAGLVTAPLRATQGLVRDVAVSARKPEVVAYWGGLAALAALGALDWPVAAVAGVGVAVAGAARRARG